MIRFYSSPESFRTKQRPLSFDWNKCQFVYCVAIESLYHVKYYSISHDAEAPLGGALKSPSEWCALSTATQSGRAHLLTGLNTTRRTVYILIYFYIIYCIKNNKHTPQHNRVTHRINHRNLLKQ